VVPVLEKARGAGTQYRARRAASTTVNDEQDTTQLPTCRPFTNEWQKPQLSAVSQALFGKPEIACRSREQQFRRQFFCGIV